VEEEEEALHLSRVCTCVEANHPNLSSAVHIVQEAKRMCREIVGILRILKEQRDMTLNEVRLTVGIEDPRAREKRLMGMEVGQWWMAVVHWWRDALCAGSVKLASKLHLHACIAAASVHGIFAFCWARLGDDAS
jgi:hypothetical protein